MKRSVVGAVVCGILLLVWTSLASGLQGDESKQKGSPLEPIVCEILPGYVYFSYREKTPGTKYSEDEAHIVILEAMKKWSTPPPIPKDWDFSIPWHRAREIIEVHPIMASGKNFPQAFLVRYKKR